MAKSKKQLLKKADKFKLIITFILLFALFTGIYLVQHSKEILKSSAAACSASTGTIALASSCPEDKEYSLLCDFYNDGTADFQECLTTDQAKSLAGKANSRCQAFCALNSNLPECGYGSDCRDELEGSLKGGFFCKKPGGAGRAYCCLEGYVISGNECVPGSECGIGLDCIQAGGTSIKGGSVCTQGGTGDELICCPSGQTIDHTNYTCISSTGTVTGSGGESDSSEIAEYQGTCPWCAGPDQCAAAGGTVYQDSDYCPDFGTEGNCCVTSGGTADFRPLPSCQVEFSNSSERFALYSRFGTFNPGEQQTLNATVKVNGVGQVDRVKFNSSNVGVALPNPAIDSSSPYQTSLVAKAAGKVVITARGDVSNSNGSANCSDTITVTVK